MTGEVLGYDCIIDEVISADGAKSLHMNNNNELRNGEQAANPDGTTDSADDDIWDFGSDEFLSKYENWLNKQNTRWEGICNKYNGTKSDKASLSESDLREYEYRVNVNIPSWLCEFYAWEDDIWTRYNGTESDRASLSESQLNYCSDLSYIQLKYDLEAESSYYYYMSGRDYMEKFEPYDGGHYSVEYLIELKNDYDIRKKEWKSRLMELRSSSDLEVAKHIIIGHTYVKSEHVLKALKIYAAGKKYKSCLQYLMNSDNRVIDFWGRRAILLYQCFNIRTDNVMKYLLEWYDLVSPEIKELGLFESCQELVVQQLEAKTKNLPWWPEGERGIPNSFLRSALFAAIQGKSRLELCDAEIVSTKDFVIKYKGKQLDRADLEVWEQAIKIAKLNALGVKCDFHVHNFLKGLDRKTGGAQYKWLSDSINRLVDGSVDITVRNIRFRGHLISSYISNVNEGTYSLTIDENMYKLYYPDGWSRIDQTKLKAYRRKPLAQWLYGFYSTNARPQSNSVTDLRALCGSLDKSLDSFRQSLKNALELLKENKFLLEWHIVTWSDLVEVSRNPAHWTGSQARWDARQKRGRRST